MIIYAHDIPKNKLLETDVCIVGAGAAGITMALELAGDSSLDVIILESGNYKDDGQSESILGAEIMDISSHYPLHEARSRLLGGSTSVWGGRCLPYDSIDFEDRDYVPFSNWPVSYSEIEQYYQRAHSYCECGEYSYTVDKALPNAPKNITEYFEDGDITTRYIERYSLPTHFGKTYLGKLKSEKNLRVILKATCNHIAAQRNKQEIDHISIRTEPGEAGFRVKARAYVLTGGGLEVTRLLLASNDIHRNGIGNSSDCLGRFYMGHISGAIANVQFRGNPDLTIYDFERDREGIYCRRRFWITPGAQKRKRLLNTAFWLENPPMADATHKNPILSMAYLALTAPVLSQLLAPASIRNAATSRGIASNKTRHLLNVLGGLPTVLGFLPDFIYRRYFAHRKLPGFFLSSGNNIYDIHYHAEQIPNPESRVTLSNRKDALGIPELSIDYKYTEQDVDSALRAHELFKHQLERTGSGKLYFKSDNPGFDALRISRDGIHQIGTTRMSSLAKNGVVDKDCRVFGTSNLFIASSSIFPTSSQANPTLTIIAFTLRLADFLKQTFSVK